VCNYINFDELINLCLKKHRAKKNNTEKFIKEILEILRKGCVSEVYDKKKFQGSLSQATGAIVS